jgi:hypothetical protein
VFLLLTLARSLGLTMRGRGEQNALLTSSHTLDDALCAAAADAAAKSPASTKFAKRAATTAAEPHRGGHLEQGEGEQLLELVGLLMKKEQWKVPLTEVLRGSVTHLPEVLTMHADTPHTAGEDLHTWTTLAAMCVMGEDHAVIMQTGDGEGEGEGEGEEAKETKEAAEGDKEKKRNEGKSDEKPVAAAAGEEAAEVAIKYCENHEDGETVATWFCADCDEGCQYLCGDCDSVLHLSKSTRGHKRVPIAKTDAAAEPLKLDCSDGCARGRLPWLMVLADLGNSKAVVEYRKEASRGGGGGGGAGSGGDGCRFCGQSVTAFGRQTGNPAAAFENVCMSEVCVLKMEESCDKMLPCGNPCCGVAGETTCFGSIVSGMGPDGEKVERMPDAEDYCRVCWSEELVR